MSQNALIHASCILGKACKAFYRPYPFFAGHVRYVANLNISVEYSR